MGDVNKNNKSKKTTQVDQKNTLNFNDYSTPFSQLSQADEDQKIEENKDIFVNHVDQSKTFSNVDDGDQTPSTQ